jgi:hypothetical protein
LFGAAGLQCAPLRRGYESVSTNHGDRRGMHAAPRISDHSARNARLNSPRLDGDACCVEQTILADVANELTSAGVVQ